MPPKKTTHKRSLSIAKESSPASIKRTRQSPRVKATPPSGLAKSKVLGSESPESSGAEDTSDYDDQEQADEPSEAEDSEEAELEADSSGDTYSGKTSKLKTKRGQPKHAGQGSAAAVSSKLKGEELLKPGVKTGLGPGTQVVIRRPKARMAGDTSYSDGTIHPNTMLFLRDLAANNKREWLKGVFTAFRFMFVKNTSTLQLETCAAGLMQLLKMSACFS